jgi:hypothetical protein
MSYPSKIAIFSSTLSGEPQDARHAATILKLYPSVVVAVVVASEAALEAALATV